MWFSFTITTGCHFTHWPLDTEGRDRLMAQADHPRLVGGRFSNPGNLHKSPVLVSCKMSRSPHLPTRILKIDIQASIGFSHAFNPNGLSNTLLSQGYVLETAGSMGMVGRFLYPFLFFLVGFFIFQPFYLILYFSSDIKFAKHHSLLPISPFS